MPQRTRNFLMAAAILAALTQNPPARAADSAMYRGNPAHTGEYDGGGGFPAQRERWRYKTGNLNRSTPAVAAGVVYAGSHTGNLYALDAATGTLKWQAALGGEIASSPAVAEGLVFVGNDAGFYALDAVTGQRKWTLATGEVVPFNHRWDYYQSSPVLEAGVVYFGSGDGAIYAVEAKSSLVIWKYQTTGRVAHPWGVHSVKVEGVPHPRAFCEGGHGSDLRTTENRPTLRHCRRMGHPATVRMTGGFQGHDP